LIEQKSLSQLRVEHDYYTTKQISELYNVSQATACNWCRRGWLKADRLGTGQRARWRVFPQQLEDEIEQRRDELIAASMKYWPSLLMKMRKVS